MFRAQKGSISERSLFLPKKLLREGFGGAGFVQVCADVAFCHGGFRIVEPFALWGGVFFCFYFDDVAVLQLCVYRGELAVYFRA